MRPTASLSGPSHAFEMSCAMAKLLNMKPSDAVAPPSRLHTGSAQLAAASMLSQPHRSRTQKGMMGTDSAEAKMSMTTTRYTAYSAMSRAVGCVMEIMLTDSCSRRVGLRAESAQVAVNCSTVASSRRQKSFAARARYLQGENERTNTHSV